MLSTIVPSDSDSEATPRSKKRKWTDASCPESGTPGKTEERRMNHEGGGWSSRSSGREKKEEKRRSRSPRNEKAELVETRFMGKANPSDNSALLATPLVRRLPTPARSSAQKRHILPLLGGSEADAAVAEVMPEYRRLDADDLEAVSARSTRADMGELDGDDNNNLTPSSGMTCIVRVPPAHMRSDWKCKACQKEVWERDHARRWVFPRPCPGCGEPMDTWRTRGSIHSIFKLADIPATPREANAHRRAEKLKRIRRDVQLRMELEQKRRGIWLQLGDPGERCGRRLPTGF